MRLQHRFMRHYQLSMLERNSTPNISLCVIKNRKWKDLAKVKIDTDETVAAAIGNSLKPSL